MKERKYKVDEWVYYHSLYNFDPAGKYRKKAVILSICAQDDFYDYEVYIEENAQYKKVKEEYLFPIEQ
tara:strand:+ start:244 stop:447 length:204 start_codon:yes stop_codon:yes gene_type:complete